MNESDLEFRILDLLDGSLPDEEFASLEAELLQNGEARKVYKRFVRLHSDLEIRYSSTKKIEHFGIVPVERIIARQRKRVMRGSLLAAAALLVISAVAMWLILAPDPPVSIAMFRTAPNSVFTLTHEGDGDAPEGDVLAEGSTIRLANGSLEGMFASGVRVVVEAPSEFRVVKQDRIALGKGVAWFHVPAKAVGFTVETPQLTVVDLGTEFGVLSADRGGDEVHVSEGSVEVTVRSQEGELQILKAGHARRLTREGRLQTIESDISRFRTELPRTVPIAIVNHSFETDVIPRDGGTATEGDGRDDFDRSLVPTGWTEFSDGRGSGGNLGIVSSADDSYFSASLANTPDADANDQTAYSAGRDLYQVLAATLQADTTYTITIDLGDRDFTADGDPIVNLGHGSTPGGNILVTMSEPGFPTPPDGGWVEWSAQFTTGSSPAGLGEALRIELTAGTNAAFFDNVRLSLTRASE